MRSLGGAGRNVLLLGKAARTSAEGVIIGEVEGGDVCGRREGSRLWHESRSGVEMSKGSGGGNKVTEDARAVREKRVD